MLKVSPLRVRVFDACRLRYRHQYIDRTRARLRPSDTAGSLVHRVLFDYFANTPAGARTPERLLELFEAGWQALSPNYMRVPGVEAHHAASVRQLRNFARCFDLQANPYLLEAYFETEIAPGIVLFGRMDRIDEERDGTLHIIDYKTGSAPEDIDAGQLRLYAIIVEEKLGRAVSRASFWHLDDGEALRPGSGQAWTIELTDDDKRQAREQLLATISEMQNVSEFPPTIGTQCAVCPYLHACEFRADIAAKRAAEGW